MVCTKKKSNGATGYSASYFEEGRTGVINFHRLEGIGLNTARTCTAILCNSCGTFAKLHFGYMHHGGGMGPMSSIRPICKFRYPPLFKYLLNTRACAC